MTFVTSGDIRDIQRFLESDSFHTSFNLISNGKWRLLGVFVRIRNTFIQITDNFGIIRIIIQPSFEGPMN
jgi:hypothetical protein